MDNMDGAEFFGRVLTVNYAFPEKITGGEQGWAAQPGMSRASPLFNYVTLCFRACVPGCLTLGLGLPNVFLTWYEVGRLRVRNF